MHNLPCSGCCLYPQTKTSLRHNLLVMPVVHSPPQGMAFTDESEMTRRSLVGGPQGARLMMVVLLDACLDCIYVNMN